MASSKHQPEQVADGVWRLQGSVARCNVYFVAEPDGSGVMLFDAGARTMCKAIKAAAEQLGGLTRVVLGHGHTDHRGSAPFLGVPVLCHPDEVVDAQGSGGFRYWDPKLRNIAVPHRWVHRGLHSLVWDGGPVTIAETVTEGDTVAGFRVVHLPGHAPGQIALYRESDGVALTTDVFYTLDKWSRDVPARIPMVEYNHDHDQARRSLLALADLEPTVAFPGHAVELRGDVAERLRAAAAAA